MTEAFQTVLGMSFSASWLILAILGLRALFRKMPKWGNVLLWGFVALRLLIPVTVESKFSLIPTVFHGIDVPVTGNAEQEISSPAISVNPDFLDGAAAEMDPLSIFGLLWMIGILFFALFFVISYFRFIRRLDTAVLLRENIYQSDVIDTSVVIGIIHPKICVPFSVNDNDLNHMITHERKHIRRRDHWWKLTAYIALMIHWFNPLVWIAYVIIGRDIELACDEAVIRDLSWNDRADYAQTLVTYSTRSRISNLYPLYFGEIGVKTRVKSVMHYKHAAVRHYVLLACVCLLLCCCFLTNPVRVSAEPEEDAMIQASQQQQGTAVDRPVKDLTGLELENGVVKGQNANDQNEPVDLRFDFAVRAQIENYQKILESMKLELIEIEAQYKEAKPGDKPPLKAMMDHYAYWIEQLEADIQSAKKQIGLE